MDTNREIVINIFLSSLKSILTRTSEIQQISNDRLNSEDNYLRNERVE